MQFWTYIPYVQFFDGMNEDSLTTELVLCLFRGFYFEWNSVLYIRVH